MISSTALLVAAIGCAAVIEGIRRWGSGALMDVPNERSSHTRPTPRGGGLGIVIVVLVGWLTNGTSGATDWIIVTLAAVIAAVSWFDDRRGIPFSARLTIHLVAAVIAIAALGSIARLWVPSVGAVGIGLLGWPLSVLWIVGLVNAYNFMDGIDGIAGGQGLVAGIAWTCISAMLGSASGVALGSLISVTCGVFLLFNWSPARIFLGDVGSATLGFLLAILPLMVARGRGPDQEAAVITAGVAIVWPFVADASFTFLRRWRRRENVFAAHRSHWYQRMVIAGWSHAQAAGLYIGLAALSAAAGVGLVRGLPYAGAAATIDAIGVPLVLWGLVKRTEGRKRG